MKITLQELLSKFEDGEKRYQTSALFHRCIDGLLHGMEPINLIDQLVKNQDDLLERHSSVIKQGSGILDDVSGSLPMWTEIHIQPLDINDIENSKVYWIKHPHLKQSIYDKDLITAIKGFLPLCAGTKPNEAKPEP